MMFSRCKNSQSASSCRKKMSFHFLSILKVQSKSRSFRIVFSLSFSPGLPEDRPTTDPLRSYIRWMAMSLQNTLAMTMKRTLCDFCGFVIRWSPKNLGRMVCTCSDTCLW